MRFVWLALAVVGTVVPMRFFISWFEANGYDLAGMIAAWNVNDAARGLTWDLTIAAIALTLFIIIDARRRRDWWSLIAIPTIYCIGVSCGLPLYLYFRERARAGPGRT